MPEPFNMEHYEARVLKTLWVLGDNHVPRHPVSLQEWSDHMMSAFARVVDFDDLGELGELSTVFLGMECSFSLGSRSPVLFETALLGPKQFELLARYRTWDEAAIGHKLALTKLCEKPQ